MRCRNFREINVSDFKKDLIGAFSHLKDCANDAIECYTHDNETNTWTDRNPSIALRSLVRLAIKKHKER